MNHLASALSKMLTIGQVADLMDALLWADANDDGDNDKLLSDDEGKAAESLMTAVCKLCPGAGCPGVRPCVRLCQPEGGELLAGR